MTLVCGGDWWLWGSKSWDAALTRICSWMRLKDRRTGKELIFGNTHYDHIGHVARENASKIIMRKLPELSKGKPVILTGDFNTTEDDPPYQTITTRPRLAWRISPTVTARYIRTA